MSAPLIIPLRTQIHLIRKSYYINPLKKKKNTLLRLKYRCLISVFVRSVSCIVKYLKQSTAETASEGHSVLFVELDCPSLSLCWCKLNRLMFLPRIKYSSQLDLPVCINVINYKGEKTASSTLSQNNQTSWVRWERGNRYFLWRRWETQMKQMKHGHMVT